MSTHIQVVRKYFEEQNRGNADSVVSLFSDDAEVYNVNFPPVRGKEGIRGFCDNLYSRTSARQFELIDTAEASNTVMAEWTVKMTFRVGATVGPWQLAKSFDVELRGINKFEFAPDTNLIAALRIYHETSTVGQLAQANAKQA